MHITGVTLQKLRLTLTKVEHNCTRVNELALVTRAEVISFGDTKTTLRDSIWGCNQCWDGL